MKKTKFKVNTTSKKTIKESSDKAFEDFKNAKPIKKYLKKRKSIICDCKGRKQAEKDRIKYGTCRCDSYSLDYTLATVISNYLYQYIADAKPRIERDDWDQIERHAKAIREFSEADSFNLVSDDIKERYDYLEKKNNFTKAMHWLTDNWKGLWW